MIERNLFKKNRKFFDQAIPKVSIYWDE